MSSHISSTAAAWFCASLIAVSMALGVFIGDRYQPFGRGPNEVHLTAVENRIENVEARLSSLRETLVEMNLPAMELDAGVNGGQEQR